MNTKVFALSCLLAVAAGAPNPEADPQLVAASPYGPYAAAPYAAALPPNCKIVNEAAVTQTCQPTAQNICKKDLVNTEEIVYDKLCKSVVDIFCDAPPAAAAVVKTAPVVAAAIAKREAEAEPQVLVAGPPAAAVVPAPVVAGAVPHSTVTTVKSSCREVVTEHCFDNPQVKVVPVEVEHCHTITKVACQPYENVIPTTKCHPVETTHVSTPAVSYARYGFAYGK